MGEVYVITKPRLLLRGADLIALILGLISTLFKALPSDSNVQPVCSGVEQWFAEYGPWISSINTI